MDNEKLGLLAEIFWEMNQLDAIVETHTDSIESETSVETEVTVLIIGKRKINGRLARREKLCHTIRV